MVARVGARQQLDRGALREPAGPRRGAAVEGEHVLPGDPPGAGGRERDHFREQLAQVRVFVRREVAVALAEGPQPLDLQALAGVVLPHDLAVGERDPLRGAQQWFGGPPLAVAFQCQEHDRQPRGDQLVGGGERLGGAEHGLQFGAAGAAEVADGAFGGHVDRQILAVGGGFDAGAVQQRRQRSADGRAAAGGRCGGASAPGARPARAGRRSDVLGPLPEAERRRVASNDASSSPPISLARTRAMVRSPACARADRAPSRRVAG